VDNHQQIINRFLIIINMPPCTPTSSPIGVPAPLLAGRSESSDHRRTLLGNRQIGQPTTAPCAQNLLPICYRHGGICYGRSRVHQVASRNRQQIVNPFPVIVNLSTPKAPLSSTNHQQSIDPFPESIDGSAQSTDPSRESSDPVTSAFSLQPLALP
jgi:hypothetical protein